MMDFGGWLIGIWGWLGVAAQGAAGTAEATMGGAQDFPFWQHLVRVAAVLSGMLGVLALGLYLWKKSGMLRLPGSSPLIKVLATHHLAPKKALILVAVGNERLLLSSCGEGLQLVAALSPDEVPSPSEGEEKPAPSFKLSLPNEKEGRA